MRPKRRGSAHPGNLRRRELLVGLSASLSLALGGESGAEGLFHPKSLADNVAEGLKANVPDGFTLAAAGDMMLTHPISDLKDPGLQSVLGWIKSADVAVGNFENSLIDVGHFAGFPGPTADSLRPTGSPDVAADVKTMGFSLVSRANNHATDWGVEGMRSTDALLDAAGVVHSGTGEDLAKARAPRFLQTPSGRIAIVSVTSTFEEAEPALPPLGEAPGRPGVSVLRAQRRVLVDHDSMLALRRLAAEQPAGSTDAQTQGARLTLFGVTYEESDKTGFAYEVNPADQAEVLRAVKQGKLSSDLLVFCVHSHEPGNWSDSPADFFPRLARSAIDAGADCVVGTGPHHLRGIDIYQGKPIFYSLGNLFFQFAPQAPVAADMYDKMFADPRQLTDAETIQSRIGVHIEQPSWFESVVAVTTFKAGAVADIRLHPIELSLDARMADRGLPRRASGPTAARILARLIALSLPFGVRVEMDGETGVVRGAGGRK